MTSALRVSGLRVTYGSIVAVDGIDLEVREGEIYGLLGPNGAGKTSALSAIEGLLRPAAGDIAIGDVDARAHPLQAKAQLGVQLQATSFQSRLLREINLGYQSPSKRFRELSRRTLSTRPAVCSTYP